MVHLDEVSTAAGVGPAERAELERLSVVSDGGVSLSPKGRRTRARLVDAAQVVFARDGFLDARIADIAAEAGVAHGTFYTYFASKPEIFRTVIGDVMEKVWHARSEVETDVNPGISAYERIERANRRFVEVFQEHTAMLGLHEQLMTYDDQMRALRMEVRVRSVERVRRSIVKMQADDAVRADLDPQLSAAALVSMVSNFCYFWLVMGEGDYDQDAVVDTLTRLWASALRLDVP